MGDNGNVAKIFPRRDPKAPKIHPGSLPEQPWALKIHSFPQSRPEKGEKATQGRESRPKVGECRQKVGPRDPPWEPAGSQNRPKITPGTEKGPLRTPRDALFATFGVQVRPESRFSSMFDHFLDDFGNVEHLKTALFPHSGRDFRKTAVFREKNRNRHCGDPKMLPKWTPGPQF